MPSATLSDEDFINKSLLASLDAQADAEPLDDSDNDSQPRFPPDSPNDNNYHNNHFLPNNFNPKPNSQLNYRASFTSYPNTTRTRQQNGQPVPVAYRDPNPLFQTSDAFSNPVTSPIQSHISSYDSRQSYDYNAQQPNGTYKSYQVDQYQGAVLHNSAKQHAQQQPQSLGGYSSPSQYPNNSIQFSSQTPYGPHIPTVATNSNAPALTNSVSIGMPNGSNNISGEEISTIFVVGFPEDMQEREFQNMFTFSQGFEAATLKIPNKEYTAYGSLVSGPPGGPLPNGLRGQGFQYSGPNDPYNLVTVNQGGVVVDGGRDGTMSSWQTAAPNDDLSNNGLYVNGPGMGLAGSTLNVPRKQIIGFAKFRTREEALAARDVLQGRRVDIEKGAVLKAEMAKKNLHTKRGVGPVPGAGVGINIMPQQQHINGLDAYNADPASFSNIGMMGTNAVGPSGTRDNLPMLARLGGRDSIVNLQQQAQLQNLSQPDYINSNGGIPSDGEDAVRYGRNNGMSGLNIGGLSLLPTGANSVHSTSSVSPNVAAATVTGASGIGGLTSTRGARERAVEDEEQRRRRRDAEKERDAKEKEINLMRLRASNAAAFDAFHAASTSGSINSMSSSVNGNGNGSSAVAPSLISRQGSTASTTSLSSGSGAVVSASSPMLAGDETAYIKSQSLESSLTSSDTGKEDYDGQGRISQDSTHHDEIIGPWDHVNGVSASAVGRSSESERSTSPPLDAMSLQSQHQQPPQYQGQYMHLESQRQLQYQQNVRSSQSEASETESVVGLEPSLSSSSANPGSPNPIGYVGARLGFATGLPSGSSPNHNQITVQGAGSQPPLFAAQTLFSRGLSGYMSLAAGRPSGSSGLSSNPNNDEEAHPSTIINTGSAIGGNVNAGGSGSTSANGTGGNTSPTLPSPASGSTTSATSAGTNGNGTSMRGTVDQNPPINTLYVGNLPTSPPPIGYPSDYLEETLRQLFSARPGYRKLCFRQKANGPMCFVEFEDVHYAAKAMQEMSGNTLRGAVKNGIRLSYSKNPLGVRTPTSAGSNNGGPTLQQQQQLMHSLNNHQQQQFNNHHQPTGTSDDFVGGHLPQQQQRVPLPTAIMRRDSTLSSNGNTQLSYNTNGGNNDNANSFFSSPPPRFYTTSPTSGIPFNNTTSSLTGASNAFIPRSAANGASSIFNAGHFGFGGVSLTAFSPFSIPFSSSTSTSTIGEGSFPPQSSISHLQPLSIPGESVATTRQNQQDE